MTLSQITMGIHPHGTGPPSPAGITPTLDSRVLAGKGKMVASKQWADEPWPLIEPPSRTRRTGHPAQHIANEVAHTHNAMLRGLNALYLQAPFIQSPADVADFCFLVHVWAAWVRDYHSHKEGVMIPKFEDALGLGRGGLRVALPFTRGEGEGEGEGEGKWIGDGNGKGKGKEEEGERGEYKPEENIPALLHNILDYTTTTHANPSSYSPSTLLSLLSTLASPLVPHLHSQIPLLQQMQDLCLTLDSPPSSTSTTTTTTTQSSSQRSTPLSSSSSSLHSTKPPTPTGPTKTTLLTKTHLATTTSFSASLDPFTALPMIVRLRDITYDGRTHDGGVWPRLSVPALHAIADRLSPKHAGSWRFLPCDVWGRPRALEFLGEEVREREGEEEA